MVWLSLQATIVRLEQEALRRRERLLQQRQEEECKEQQEEDGEDDDDDDDDDCGNSSSESDEEEEEEEMRIFDDDDNSSGRRRRQYRPLQNLHVRENHSLGLGLQGAQVLSEALQQYASDEKEKTTLRRLSLYSNNLGNAGLWQLRPALYQLQSSLVDLNLRSNHITAAGATVLSGLVKLQRLDLGYNQLGDEGVEALQLHRHSRLKSLYLFSNGITQRGAATILSLKTRLREVLLQGNAIGGSCLEEGEFQLLESGQCSPKLRALYMDDNGISTGQAQSLMKQLEHLHLDILSLRDNAIEKTEVLQAGMVAEPQIRFLDLEGNGKRPPVPETKKTLVMDTEDPDPPGNAPTPASPPRRSLVHVDWGSSSPTATTKGENNQTLEQLEQGISSAPVPVPPHPPPPPREAAPVLLDKGEEIAPMDAVGQLMKSLMQIIPRDDFDLLRWSSHEDESSDEEAAESPLLEETPSPPDKEEVAESPHTQGPPDTEVVAVSLPAQAATPSQDVAESLAFLDKYGSGEDMYPEEPPQPPDKPRDGTEKLSANRVVEERNVSMVRDQKVENGAPAWSSAEVTLPLQQPMPQAQASLKKADQVPKKWLSKTNEASDGDYHFATDDEASFCAAVEQELQQMEHSLETKVPSSPLLAASSSSSFTVVQELQHLLWKPLGLLAHENEQEGPVVPGLVVAEDDSGGTMDDSARGEGNGSNGSSSVSSSSSSNNSLRSALDEYLRKVVTLGWESMELGMNDDEDEGDDEEADASDDEHEVSSSVGGVLPEPADPTTETKKKRRGRGRSPKAVARRVARFLYRMMQHRRKKKKAEGTTTSKTTPDSANDGREEQEEDVNTQATTDLKTSSLSLWSSSSSLARHSTSSLNLLASAKAADTVPAPIREQDNEAEDAEEVAKPSTSTALHKSPWKTTQSALSSVFQATAHAGSRGHWASVLFMNPTQ